MSDPESKPAIPGHEMQILVQSIIDADDLAREGELSQGYNCLCAGLARARECQEYEDPYADVLVSAWQREIQRYCTEWGVSV
jgi:hypothetical protein